MDGVIRWNGQRSDQFGILIEKYPDYNRPQRKADVYNVPGRSGDIIMVQDAWENVKQRYDIYAGSGAKGSVPGSLSDVADWLYSADGYAELWDDYDPDHFRMAYFIGPFDAQSLSVGKFAKVPIEFDCMPQRYLVSGKDPVTISSAPATLSNPTAYKAKPLIFVEISGDGTVTIGNTIFTLTGISNNVYIDCNAMKCYDGDGTNLNSAVSSNTSEFAVLVPGSNSIGFTGDVQSLEITPRWFEL